MVVFVSGSWEGFVIEGTAAISIGQSTIHRGRDMPLEYKETFCETASDICHLSSRPD